MIPINIGTEYVSGDMPVVRIDPQSAPMSELVTARIQLLPDTDMEAHSYGDSEVVLTGVHGALEVGVPGRDTTRVTPGICVMVPRGELFTLRNRTSRPAAVLAVFSRGELVDGLPRSHRVRQPERVLHAAA